MVCLPRHRSRQTREGRVAAPTSGPRYTLPARAENRPRRQSHTRHLLHPSTATVGRSLGVELRSLVTCLK